MSAISQKSISGITSITTPAGVDNQLTLHTNDTTQRVKVTQSGIEAVGVATFQDIDVDGHTNLDNVNIVGVVTVSQQVHTFAQQITGDNQDSLDFTGSSTNQNRGIAFNGATALSAEQNKTWLRLNNNGEFSNGTYTPGLFRADGGFDTDGNTIVTSTGQINGSRILTGTIPVAQIGTGTKNTSTFYRGDGTFATVTAPAITTINSAANNRLVTSDGGTTVTAESGLTWSGAQLYIESTGDSQIRLQKPSSDSNDWNYIEFAGANGTRDSFFGTWSDGTPTWSRDDGNTKIQILNGSATINGHWRAEANNTYDLGTSTYRWRNLYINDLQLSNEARKEDGGNDVDGTWGDFTIQEGESDLFLINKRNGKKYKFNLTEVS